MSAWSLLLHFWQRIGGCRGESVLMGVCAYLCANHSLPCHLLMLIMSPWERICYPVLLLERRTCMCVIYDRLTKAPFSFGLPTCVLTLRVRGVGVGRARKDWGVIDSQTGSFCTACLNLCKQTELNYVQSYRFVCPCALVFVWRKRVKKKKKRNADGDPPQG